jgi:hypothetical protein
MNLGAMLDLGVDGEFLSTELKKLDLQGYRISISREKRNGIEGTKVDVVLDTQDYAHEAAHNHARHEHVHGHDHGTPAHPHTHQTGSGHVHVHLADAHHADRNLAAITALIRSSALSDRVKERSIAIFTRLAEAEAKIHGTTVDAIHFHEVGAVDSIIDIVGAVICHEYLEVDSIMCGTVELGGGFVTCKHGTIPVPAPATVELLKGKPVHFGAVNHETATPTGAAILAAQVDRFTDQPEMVIRKVAYGVGQREGALPNLLRVFLGDSAGDAQAESDTLRDTAVMLECNIDDMSPELHGYLMEKLFEQGADDVFFTPVIMKKSRPAVILNVLCRKEQEDRMTELFLTETSTLGLRSAAVNKIMLRRKFETISTSLGDVSLKTGIYKGKSLKMKPEYDDCRRIAKEKKLPLHEVYAAVASALSARGRGETGEQGKNHGQQ